VIPREIYAIQQVGFPILSALILLPLAVAAALFFIASPRLARRAAIAGALAELALSLALVARFTPRSSDFQFVERRSFLPTLGATYHVGVDGISVLFIPLTALLVVLVMVASWSSVTRWARVYLVALLALEAVTIGIFAALDTVLFFTFWELLLVPSFALISLFGVGPERRYAAQKYFLYMLVGSLPVLVGILLLAVTQRSASEGGAPGGAPLSPGYAFDYLTLLARPLSPRLQTAIFALFFIGFAVKGPVFPFHTWLPTVIMESPVGFAVLVAGLKLGLYGMLRFVFPLAPLACSSFAWILSGLGVLGVIYGALVALAQPNLRRMLAFSSVSHVGFLLVGLASLTAQGIQGAVFQMLNMGFITTGLLFLAGFLHHRLGSSEILALGGVAKKAPFLAAFFLLLGLASIGLPGTSGFSGEHLILIGAFRSSPLTGLFAVIGVVLGAAYFLGSFERAFLGPIERPAVLRVSDLRPREWIIAGCLGAAVLGLGIYPAPVLAITGASVQAIADRVTPLSETSAASARIRVP
jgi:NADH-quinone oxidoreductase subunit M